MAATLAHPNAGPLPARRRSGRVAAALRTLALVVTLGASTGAHAVEGFVIGLEAGRGKWDVPFDPLVNGGVNPLDAARFQQAFHGLDTNGFGLHFGWNFAGHAAINLAFAGTAWEPFNDSRGGVGYGGLRAQWFPLQLFLTKDRKFDVALEFGGGYSIAGGPSRGMMGAWFDGGAIVSYMPVKWFSVGLFYRQYFFPWNNFLYNLSAGDLGDVTNYLATWGTPGIQLGFHFPPPG